MNSKTVYILVVEDDPSLQEGLSDLLEVIDVGHPVEILTAENGLKGLDVLSKQIPDLIVSDIMMPQMDGLKFLDVVRDKMEWVHIPFIFLTAKGKKNDIQTGKQSGAERYITKPFNSDDLIKTAENQIKRSLQRQEAQNKNMSQLKRSILQLLNHEFRTPLTYVTAYYEMLSESLSVYDDAQNMSDYLKGIQSGCERLIDLVEDLILVMDTRTGEMRKAYDANAEEIFDLYRIAKDAASELESVSQREQVPIEINIPVLPAVLGVREHLQTAVRHLLENGIKFTVYKIRAGESHSVRITAEQVDDEIHIHVIDRGIGIPATQHHTIFDVFSQYNREYYEQQGSGSGLVIVKGIIDAHNGRVAVKSEEETGSTFTVILPTAKKQKKQSRQTGLKNRRSANLLLVEDDIPLLESLQDLLRIYWGPYKLNIETATDGAIALEKAKMNPPDLIISDVMMPNMNGYELLNHVREDTNLLHIPFIFLSAKSEPRFVHHGLNLGAEEYISKPYDTDELMSLITTQLNRYFQLQQVSQQDFDVFKQGILNLLRPEFRVPLSSVNEYSHSLSEGLANVNTSDGLKTSLKEIRKGSQQISTLVEDFITLAELKTGEAGLAFSTRAYPITSLSFLLEESYRKHRLSRTASIKQVIHLEAQAHPILIDQTSFVHAFSRIFGILLQVGLEQEAKNIYVSGNNRQNNYQITVWQDGKNLPKEMITKFNNVLQESEDEKVLESSEYAPGLRIMSKLLTIHRAALLFESGLHKDGRITPDYFIVTFPYAPKNEISL